MSEPNLALQYADLRMDVALELGYGVTAENWTAGQIAQIDRVMRNGYRRFLWPDILPGERIPHQWTFLHPTAEIILWPTTTGEVDGTPVYTAPSSAISLTTGTAYPTMVGKSITFITSGNSYTILSYVSASSITVSGDASGEDEDDDFTITADGDYRMPDDFGNMIGSLFIQESNSLSSEVFQKNVSDILRRRAENELVDTPTVFAIAPATMTGQTTGQRQTLMAYPTPSAVITAKYRYSILPDAITATYTFHRGTETHSKTVRSAILSQVDRFRRTDSGHEADFINNLRVSVMLDRLSESPDNMGYNGDRSGSLRDINTVIRNQRATITYNGEIV